MFAQCESIDRIQQQRKRIWDLYESRLRPFAEQGHLELPHIPNYATNNAHMMYLVCKNLEQRTSLINHLKEAGIYAVFHYLSLHRSPYYAPQYKGGDLPHADRFTDCLLRHPMFYELRDEDVHDICDCIASWIQQNFD